MIEVSGDLHAVLELLLQTTGNLGALLFDRKSRLKVIVVIVREEVMLLDERRRSIEKLLDCVMVSWRKGSLHIDLGSGALDWIRRLIEAGDRWVRCHIDWLIGKVKEDVRI